MRSTAPDLATVSYASGFIRELADCASICARLRFGSLSSALEKRVNRDFASTSMLNLFARIDTDESVAREHSARWSTAQRAVKSRSDSRVSAGELECAAALVIICATAAERPAFEWERGSKWPRAAVRTAQMIT